jgi:4-amino-4-deoxy-L-arabinose transferase-like glycosyltransferase
LQSNAFPASALDWLSRTHLRACALLLVLALGCFLPGFASLQPMDRDEPRFAQATKQMLETGDFIDIRFQEEARHKKPAGIYWLQSITVSAGQVLGVENARTQIWLYRMPSLLGAIATVLLTYWALLAFLPPRLALLGGAVMAASILLGVEARLAKTDAVLAACSIAAMGALARVWLDWTRSLAFIPDDRNWLVFWGAVALAVIVKGPILPMVLAITIIGLSLRERGLGWLAALRSRQGFLIVLAVVLPWFIAIAWKSGGAFFAESIGKDMLGKVSEGQEKHGAPSGFYFLAFFATFWPAAPIAAMAAPFAWINRREPAVIFLLLWLVPSWLVFEAVPTKLPHYVLPLYPAIAGLMLLAVSRAAIDHTRRGAMLVAVLIALIPLALLWGISGASWMLDRTWPFAAWPCLIAGSAVAIWAVFAVRRGAFEPALWRGVLASLIVSASVYGLANPALRSLKLSPRLAETLNAASCRNPAVMTAGYREPSLVFLTRTDLKMGDGAEAARFLAQPGCRIAFVSGREQAAFEAEAARTGLSPRLVTRISGFNINGGRRIDINVLAGGG